MARQSGRGDLATVRLRVTRDAHQIENLPRLVLTAAARAVLSLALVLMAVATPGAASSALILADVGVAGAGASPAPQDAASPSPNPTALSFPTIGRARSRRYCQLEIDRANGAITVALSNDKIIAGGIARLRSADLDKPDLTVIQREKSLRDLRAVAAAIQTNLRAGDAQLNDLRSLSVREPDAARSPELKALADQLDDTYGRQRSIGSDLAKMLTIIDGRRAGDQGRSEAAGVMLEKPGEHVRNGLPPIDQRAAYEPLNVLFADVADEFGDRAVDIGRSEGAAAVHAPKAVTGC